MRKQYFVRVCSCLRQKLLSVISGRLSETLLFFFLFPFFFGKKPLLNESNALIGIHELVT